MRFRRTLAEPDEPIELNLIPLIDIIMFLLIFFISTTSFIEEPGVKVDKPQAASASQLEKNSIIFAVTPDGKVAYGGKEIGLGGVRPRPGCIGHRTLRLDGRQSCAWNESPGLPTSV